MLRHFENVLNQVDNQNFLTRKKSPGLKPKRFQGVAGLEIEPPSCLAWRDEKAWKKQDETCGDNNVTPKRFEG
jgi:hypothetical protein